MFNSSRPAPVAGRPPHSPDLYSDGQPGIVTPRGSHWGGFRAAVPPPDVDSTVLNSAPTSLVLLPRGGEVMTKQAWAITGLAVGMFALVGLTTAVVVWRIGLAFRHPQRMT